MLWISNLLKEWSGQDLNYYNVCWGRDGKFSVGYSMPGGGRGGWRHLQGWSWVLPIQPGNSSLAKRAPATWKTAKRICALQCYFTASCLLSSANMSTRNDSDSFSLLAAGWCVLAAWPMCLRANWHGGDPLSPPPSCSIHGTVWVWVLLPSAPLPGATEPAPQQVPLAFDGG